MHQRVTAVLVARSGSTHLQRTLDALAAQTRTPDAVVVIDVGTDEASRRIIAAAHPTHFLATEEKLSFGAAVAAAERAIEPAQGENEWLWLLAQDTAPEPMALERMLAVVEVSPSVAVAGPKLVDWDDRAYLREFGLSMTRYGASVALVEDELDQAQHDDLSDVLGVSEAAMLVRHGVWTALGGLDLGLPVVDGGLDFSVRARLAGHRVVLAPTARVAHAGDGVVGARRSRRTGVQRVSHRVRRTAQLHRRMAYAPAWSLLFHWLSLVPLAVVRSLGWLLAKHPGAIGGELAAAFATAFGAGHLAQARRRLRAARTVGWASIAPLRMPPRQMRQRRMLAREAALTLTRGERRDIDFFGTGGAWVVLAAVLVAVVVQTRLLGSSVIGGGALLPLSSDVGSLWRGIGWGWRDIGAGFTGPSDPFSAVLAVIGSLTFWQPSFSLVLLWFAAIPLSALGAWLLATRISARPSLRAVLALVYAASPVLFADLAAGRPAAVLTQVLLPWLVLAAVNARRSWAASGATAILGAAVAACAPSLIPALAIAWLVWTVTSGRAIFRTIGVPLPAIALFLPLAMRQLSRGHWLQLFADPGVPTPAAQPPVWQLVLGFPGGSVGGWSELAAQYGLSDAAPQLLLVVLFAPLAVLALLAVFLRGTLKAAAALLGALLGLATAVLSVHVAVSTSGPDAVALWSGPGLSLMWLGLAAGAALGLAALGRAAIAPTWVAALFALAAVVPVAIAGPLGRADVVPDAAGALPAYVAAEAAQHPRTATLVIVPTTTGALTAQLVHGAGTTLDDQSTVDATATTRTAVDRRLATLAANLVSRSGYDPAPALKSFGISFVLVEGAGADASAAQSALTSRAGVALDGDALFAQVGTSSAGTLWSTVKTVPPVAEPAVHGRGLQRAILALWIIVFGFCVLLSIPTGRVSEADVRRARRMLRPDADRAGEGEASVLPADVAEATGVAAVPAADDASHDAALVPAPEELAPAFAGAANAFAPADEDTEN